MKELLRLYIQEALLVASEDLDEDELDEFSGGGVQMSALPLGTSPKVPKNPFVPASRKLGKDQK